MMRRVHRSGREETAFWQSYSDIMASILMVTVLVLTGTILNAQKRVIEKENLIKDEKARLSEVTDQLEKWKIEIDDQEVELNKVREEYQKQKEQMQKILGIKLEIIEELVKRFEGETQLRINRQTGAIVFDSKLLFDTDESDLKSSGKEFLDQFMPIYMSVLNDDRFRDMITEIIVEGHADKRGDYLHNLKLSQDRAYSVASYFLSEESDMFSGQELEHLREIVTANGRSFSVPVRNEDGTENLELSRRVEIQFRLTDEEMIRDLIAVVDVN